MSNSEITFMTTQSIRSFRKILRSFERELAIQNQSSSCCGVSLAQCHVLMELDIQDNVTLNILAKNVGLDKSTVSRTVETLVNLKMVDRVIPKNNRRTTQISLTDQGKQVVKTIHAGNDAYYQDVLDRIPDELRKPFLDGFRLMADSMALENQKNS